MLYSGTAYKNWHDARAGIQPPSVSAAFVGQAGGGTQHAVLSGVFGKPSEVPN